MNKFIEDVIRIYDMNDITLKISYSTHIGWTIKLHKKGSDMPVLEVVDQDKDKAIEEAYIKLLEIKKGD